MICPCCEQGLVLLARIKNQIQDIRGIKIPVYNPFLYCYTDLRENNCDRHSGCQPISGVSPHFTAFM